MVSQGIVDQQMGYQGEQRGEPQGQLILRMFWLMVVDQVPGG